MTTINWIELWMLNESAIANTIPLSHFLGDPVNREWVSPWEFPGRDILQSTQDERKKTLLHCSELGWLAVYKSLETNLYYSNDDVVELNLNILDDSNLWADFLVILTFAGHQKWEAEFKPDWRRFWRASAGIVSGADRKISIAYASNEILADIITWYPAYIGLGKVTTPTLSDSRTEYCFRATVWRVLERVKTATLTISNEDIAWKILERRADEDTVDSIQIKARTEEFNRVSRILSSDQQEAHRVLRKLSLRWDTVNVPGNDLRDSIPISNENNGNN